MKALIAEKEKEFEGFVEAGIPFDEIKTWFTKALSDIAIKTAERMEMDEASVELSWTEAVLNTKRGYNQAVKETNKRIKAIKEGLA
ncbi:MAG TPA: hypothetical protein ENI23_14020 [bacterium]|nr:hypothetical protein [bacterium]